MSYIDEDDFLCISKGGIKIPKLIIDANMIMDKTIVIYGPSGTGKTIIIKNIMGILDGHIEQVFVVSPSEPSNCAYDGFVKSPLIHYRMFIEDPENPKKDDPKKGMLRFIDAIWKRQEMMSNIYKRANKMDTLMNLYMRLPTRVKKDAMKYIQLINSSRVSALDMVTSEDKKKEINSKFKKMLVMIYKKYIIQDYESLYKSKDLSDDEKYTLRYIVFNPRLLLIFDDCAAQLKAAFNTEQFRRLFYQNRHSSMTICLSCQDDTDLCANLRKNAFISFFTEPIVTVSNFTRGSNQFPNTVKQYINNVVKDLFQDYRKLAYIREDATQQQFYYIKFSIPPTKLFGSQALHELCDEVKNDGNTMDTENPYFKVFNNI